MKYLFKLRERVRCVSWRRILEDPRRLRRWNLFQLMVVYGGFTKELGITAHWLSKRIWRMYRNSGPRYTCLYLKQCHLALQKALASTLDYSYVPLSKMPMVSLTKKGLPRLIPAYHRKVIRRGDSRSRVIVRLYLTAFSFYRVIGFRGSANVSSIIDSGYLSAFLGSGRKAEVLPNYLKKFLIFLEDYTLVELRRVVPDLLKIPLITGFSDKISWSSGPNVKSPQTQLFGLGVDCWVTTAYLDCKVYRTLAQCASYALLFNTRVWYPGTTSVPMDKFREKLLHLQQFMGELGGVCFQNPPSHYWLGRLARKEEPAGKVRLFAIMDAVRQRLLFPLHEWVAELLRRIPQDGTFNQLRCLKGIRGPRVSSFDLTSATDRFPYAAQAIMWNALFGRYLSESWTFLLDVPLQYRTDKGTSELVRFQEGVPLGTYSAWPSFALCHHLMVQFCAALCGKKGWFPDYRILGDDLVIDDPQVAAKYKLVALDLGVVINDLCGHESDNGSF